MMMNRERRLSQNWRKKKRRDLIKLACIQYLGGVCMKCHHRQHPSTFDFHHRNPNNKVFSISAAIYKDDLTFEQIKDELDKCDLLCSNCHRLLHSEEVENQYRGVD
jgi:predicted HNH restriction endonuclease